MPTTPEQRIGDVLIQCGLVNREQLDAAEAIARREQIRIGEALMHMGVLEQDQLSWALGVQFKLSYVDLDSSSIDWSFIRQFPLARLRELRLLPLSFVDGTVHAVVADPTRVNLDSIQAELFPGKELVVQLADEDTILQMLKKSSQNRSAPVQLSHSDRDEAESWLEECVELLATGRMEEPVLAIQQDHQAPERFRIIYPPVDSTPEPLRAGLVLAMLELMRERFAEELVISGGWGGWIPALLDAQGAVLRAPVRGTFLHGCNGQAIIFERVAVNPASMAPSRTLRIRSRDPIRIKAAAARARAVIFESHRDALFTAATVQIAFAIPQHRSVMARRVAPAFPATFVLWEALSTREADLAPSGFIPNLVILQNDATVREDVFETAGGDSLDSMRDLIAIFGEGKS